MPVKADEDGLTVEKWKELNKNDAADNASEVLRLVYFGGVAPELRKEIWPYLLGHYTFGSSLEERQRLNETCKHYYETTMSEWLAVDAIVQQREKEKTARAVAKLSSGSNSGQDKTVRNVDLETCDLENEVFEDISDVSDPGDLEFEDDPRQQLEKGTTSHLMVKPIPRAMKTSTDSGNVDDLINEEENRGSSNPLYSKELGDKSTASSSSYDTVGNGYTEFKPDTKSILSPVYLSADDFADENPASDKEKFLANENNFNTAVIVTNASMDVANWELGPKLPNVCMQPVKEQQEQKAIEALQEPKSCCVSPASSNGGVYSVSILLKLHNKRLSRKPKSKMCHAIVRFFSQFSCF